MRYPRHIKRRAIELKAKTGSASQTLRALEEELRHKDPVSGEETIPLLPCEMTIRRWYKASLAIDMKKEQARLEAHRKELGAIVDFLWSQDFHRVVAKQTKTGTQADIFEYFFEEGGIAFTREKLSQIVFEVWNYAREVYGNWKLECLLSHLEAELPEIESKGFMDFVKENPYKLIETIGMLARRKQLKGTCPICESWH